MARRDFVAEIQAARARNHRRRGAFGDALRRLDPLMTATASLKNKSRLTGVERELVRYTPVAVVACIEGYFKGLLCDFLNLGNPFLQNAIAFKVLRITLEGLVNSHTRTISVGELLSHSLSVSCLEDIDHHMSIVLNRPFLKELRTVAGLPKSELSKLPRLFDFRHILAHEIAPNFALSVEESLEFQIAAFALLLATEDYVQNYYLPSLKSAA